jgi:hypothetical protein
MKLRVHDLIGELCMTYEDGEALLAKLRPALIDHPQVEVDFEGTRVHMTPFFNGSLVALLQDYHLDDLRQKLIVQNLPAHAAETLRRRMADGERYYHDPIYQKAVDGVVEAHFEHA